MFTLTDNALHQLGLFFVGRDPQPVRLYLASSDCGGYNLSLALDRKRDTDSEFEYDGFTFVVDSELLEHAKPVVVDATDRGFTITSALKTDGSSAGGEKCENCTCS